MEKIYYTEKGWVCQRYPYDLPVTDESRFIEVEEKLYNETLSSPEFFAWRVVNGELVNEHYEDQTAEEQAEEQQLKIAESIRIKKEYLAQTDYVITKISEAVAEGDTELQTQLLAEYSEILIKRKEARSEINKFESELAAQTNLSD